MTIFLYFQLILLRMHFYFKCLTPLKMNHVSHFCRFLSFIVVVGRIKFADMTPIRKIFVSMKIKSPC
jgi:hypothetical protein